VEGTGKEALIIGISPEPAYEQFDHKAVMRQLNASPRLHLRYHVPRYRQRQQHQQLRMSFQIMWTRRNSSINKSNSNSNHHLDQLPTDPTKLVRLVLVRLR
jgi:hypothetical protein